MPDARRVVLRSVLTVLLTLPALARSAVVASVFGGRVPCVEQGGVQFCQGSRTARVESWDGVPLDANVTLPTSSMTGPFPLIVDLHGWGLGKTGTPYTSWAGQGYVVLSYSARGFQESCGLLASRATDPTLAEPDVCTARGWVHLADARYEGHDTQYLAGVLADEGLVIPDRVGVTGASYGGGQSMILAALKDRVMQVDGSFVPWTSPHGLAMKIAAAAPLIPWSDLAYALTPNGRTLDYRVDNPYGLRPGIQKQSWNALLYDAGLATGQYAPPGVDPGSDLQTWNARIGAGEPYDGDSAALAILDEITSHHSAYYVDDSEEPAPLFIYNAWTDDLFPADEALRFWRKTRSKYPDAEIALHFEDGFGHPRASLVGNVQRVVERVDQFFARHLRGTSDPAAPPVETYTQACGGSTETGPFTAPDWDALHPGEVRFKTKRVQQFDQAGGDSALAAALDPIAGGPCRTFDAADEPDAATYLLPPATGAGYTLMGSPTVIADLAVRGGESQIAARLWDVGPDMKQALIAHSLYRPRLDNLGPQVFQLHPNGWHFAAGHRAKLELLGRSVPYGRASNGTFLIAVNGLELRLPVMEAPGGVVKKPARAVQFPADPEPPACPPAPRAGCAAAAPRQGATIAITAGLHGRLAWTWRPASTLAPEKFGDPLATTGIALCVYDAKPQLLADAAVPPGGSCGARPCWKQTQTGFAFRDRSGRRAGVRTVTMVAGDAAAAHVDLVAQGSKLGVAALPATGDLPVTAQVVTSDGSCWSATFGTARVKRQKLSATSD